MGQVAEIRQRNRLLLLFRKSLKREPDRFAPHDARGNIGVGQVVNSRRNEAVGYAETLAKARELHNEQAIAELEKLAPYSDADSPPSLAKVVVERRWDRALGGMRFGQQNDDEQQVRWLSPAYTAYDRASADLGEQQSAAALIPQLWQINFDGVTEFKCPIIFFAGSSDRTTPTSIVEDYVKKIHAPVKKFFRIERAAHYVVNESPGIVLMHLVNDVKPLSGP